MPTTTTTTRGIQRLKKFEEEVTISEKNTLRGEKLTYCYIFIKDYLLFFSLSLTSWLNIHTLVPLTRWVPKEEKRKEKLLFTLTSTAFQRNHRDERSSKKCTSSWFRIPVGRKQELFAG